MPKSRASERSNDTQGSLSRDKAGEGDKEVAADEVVVPMEDMDRVLEAEAEAEAAAEAAAAKAKKKPKRKGRKGTVPEETDLTDLAKLDDAELARRLAAEEERGRTGADPEADAKLARKIAEKEARRRRRRPELEAEDEKLARRLAQSEAGGRRSRPDSSHEDAAMAAAILEAEMAAVEERRNRIAIRNAVLQDDPTDYMRAKNYEPYFCRSVLVVTSFFMFLEFAVNGWTFEPLSENPLFGPSVDTLLTLGARKTDLILAGDFHRLFTPMLLHGGLLHLIFNMLGLWNIGYPSEREFGHWKIAVIYVSSGVMGVLISAIMVPVTVGVGASGAIFGLFGSAWADLIQNWSLYREQARCVLFQLLASTIFNLGLGLLPFLDNYAHVGGFLTGLILGFTLLVQNRYDVWGFRKARRNYQLALQACAITIIPIIFVVFMLVLYLEVDLATSCTGCSYISCLPMPPGAAEEDMWWDCSQCGMISLEAKKIDSSQEAYTLTCPTSLRTVTSEEAEASGLTVGRMDQDTSLLRVACKRFCLGLDVSVP